MLFVVDNHCRIVYCNETAEKFYLTSAENYMGLAIDELVPGFGLYMQNMEESCAPQKIKEFFYVRLDEHREEIYNIYFTPHL